jgi:hypothetical protein
MNRFQSLLKSRILFMPSMLAAVVAGCGGGGDGGADRTASTRSFATTTMVAGAPAANPTISLENPSYGETNVPTSTNGSNNVVTGTVVTVGFTQPMDPATVNSSAPGMPPAFTLRDAAGNNVPGTVSMNAAHTLASFTPSAVTLTANSRYTASVSAAAKNAAGAAMPNAGTWSFTTTAAPSTGQVPVSLGTARNFVILSKSGISTVPGSVLNGNIGVSPIAHTAITGFSETADSSTTFARSAQVRGKIYTADYAAPIPEYMTMVVGDMESAYTDAAGRALPDFIELGAGEIGGKSLVPGLYKWGTGVSIATDVTLTGGPNDVWIFQVAGTLTQASATRVILKGGARPKNVFWQVADVVAIGTGAHFEGVILAKTMIAMKTGASANGRLLAQTAVTLDQNAVNQPAP